MLKKYSISKRCVIGCVTIVLFSMTNFVALASVTENTNIEGFRFYKDINSKNPDLEYKEFFLDKDVYAKTNAKQSDLLIVDEDRNEVPYYIVNSLSSSNRIHANYTAEAINNFVKYDNEYFDFRVNKPKDNEDIIINSINLDIPGENFARSITVSGSYDGKEWTTIQTSDIYRVSDRQNLRFKFDKEVRFEYFRFMIPERSSNIKVTGIVPVYNQEVTYDEKYVQKTDLKFSVENGNVNGITGNVDNESKPADTILTINNENCLKLINVELMVDGNFKRYFEVYDAKPADSKALYISGEISAFDKNKNTIINFEGSKIFPLNTKKIAMKIRNNDDQPIQITGIKGEYLLDKVVYKPGRGTHRLYFGNDGMQVSRKYDIDQFRDKIESDLHEISILGKLHQIPVKDGGEKELVSRYKKPIMNGIVIFTALVLIYIVARKLKLSNKTKQ